MTQITEIDYSNARFYMPMFPSDVLDEVVEDERTLIFGIDCDGFASGTIAVHMLNPEAEIFWYYLDPAYRNMGIGRDSMSVLTEYLRYVYGIDYVSMEMSGDSDARLSRLFDPALVTKEKLKRCRYESTVGWLRSAERIQGKSKNCIALKDVEDFKLQAFGKELRQAGMDYVYLPIDPAEYLGEASCVYMENGAPSAILLVKDVDGELEISFLASLSKNPMAVIDLIRFTREAFDRVDEDTKIYMNILDEKMAAFVKEIADIADDDEGIKYNYRVTLPLFYLDEIRDEVNEILELWKEVS